MQTVNILLEFGPGVDFIERVEVIYIFFSVPYIGQFLTECNHSVNDSQCKISKCHLVY
jgi:hypothetical protein